jgi:16S rRNA (guanine527-N7)-methyltransferase
MNKQLIPFLNRAKECYELKELERLGLTPDMEQREMILSYISLILKWNPVSNLISSNDENCLFLRHFCDSIQPLLLFGFKKYASVLDIGAGGGFPSIPIRIFRPDLTFVLVESNRKKASFLREVKSELEIENMKVINSRIGGAQTPDEQFDYIISRGTSSLRDIAHLAKPYVAPDGRIYTFKTKRFENELNDIIVNKEKDGIGISEIAEYDLGNQIHGLNLVSLELI